MTHTPANPTGTRRLSDLQAAFVRAYARDSGRGGAAAAAREAGYRPNRAGIHGYRQLRKDYILAAIGAEPGGPAALAHLATTTRSPRIRTLCAFVMSGDPGIRVVATGDRIFVLIDRSAAAARRHALTLVETEQEAEGLSAVHDGTPGR